MYALLSTVDYKASHYKATKSNVFVRQIPVISSEQHTCRVREEHTHTAVCQLKAKAVLDRIVDPLRDECWTVTTHWNWGLVGL